MKKGSFPRLRFVFVLGLLLSAIAYVNAQAQGETRVALVIGNSDYPNVPLKNPANDARDLAKALGGLGFAVNLVVNGDFATMNRAIRDFGNAIKRPDAVALFYYSGHGIQYQGANYLIPTKADIQDADELSYSAVNAEAVYSKMQSSGDKTNLIILDACRNNPFPGTERSMDRGLAVVGNIQPPQSLIVYATAPGKTAQDGDGNNGVFTAALIKHLADPSLDAELMIRRVREEVIATTGGAQVPWANSSITGAGFAFAGGGRLLVATDPAGAEIYVGGEKKGISPLALSDLPRFTEIEISAKIGNKGAVRRLTLTEASERRLDLLLEVARGKFQVKASEAVSAAFLDGAAVSMDSTGLVQGVEVGSHSIELRGDNSSFKGKVEVSAETTAILEARLVAMGALNLTLPQGSVCRIEGMGIDDASSVFNYGPVPAGSYKLSVAGGDFEAYSQQAEVERGKTLNFAPKLRYTAAFLTSKYGADLDRLQAVAEGGAASQADVDDAAVLSRKIRAESRQELADLSSRADRISAALAALRPAAALAPAAPVAASASLGSKGPAQLYATYASELGELAKFEMNQAIAQEDIDRVAAFSLKAQVQPYTDFQELANQAEKLKARLVVLKVDRDFEAMDAEYLKLAATYSKASPETEAGIAKDRDLLARAAALPDDPRYAELAGKAKDLGIRLIAMKRDWDRQVQLNALVRDRSSVKAKYDIAQKKRRGIDRWTGGAFITSVLSLAAAVTCNYLSVRDYAQYNAATTSADATKYQSSSSLLNVVAISAACTSLGAFVSGSLPQLAKPKVKGFKESMDSLDRQIRELGGSAE